MAIVTLEIDIDAKGNPIVTPNPVSVADGDLVAFHVRSNAHGGGLLTVIAPGNESSPFGKLTRQSQIHHPKRCVTTQPSPDPARWPEGATRYSMKVRFESSPAIDVEVVLLKAKVGATA